MFRGIIKNTVFVFITDFSKKFIGFLTIFVLVRVLDQEQFGLYQFILTCVSVCTVFCLPGLKNSVLQSVSRGHTGVFRAALTMSFFSSLLSCYIFLVLALWFSQDSSLALFWGFLVASMLFPFAYGLRLWRQVKAAQENFSYLLKAESISAFMSSFLIISFTLLFPGNIIIPLVIVLFVPALQNLWVMKNLFSHIPKNASIEAGIIQYGIKTTFYSGTNIVANQIDKLLIFAFLSPAALAVYYAAERLSELAKSLSQNLASTLAPRFAKTGKYTPELDRILTFISVAIGVSILIFSFTLLPMLVVFLFGNEYSETIPYAQALMLSVAIGNHATFRNRFVNSQPDAKSNRDINLTVNISRILFSFLFIPTFGLYGAVASSILYRLLTVGVLHYIVKNRYLRSSQ